MRQILTGALCALFSTLCPLASAQETTSPAAPTATGKLVAANASRHITTHVSPHFRLHTDLAPAAALEALGRMEESLAWAARHWQRRLRGKVVCYLADQIDGWSADELPHPHARVWIKYVDGATVFDHDSKGDKARHQATIYASTRPGVVEHETIHAYCAQTFGHMGPDWYKEGMAELAGHIASQRDGHSFAPELLATLHAMPHRSVDEIVEAAPLTGDTYDWLKEKFTLQNGRRISAARKDWTDGDTRDLAKIREEYYWSWSLCYLLLNNPNYERRFRTLGECYLAGQIDGAFESLFGSLRREIAFEHAFLLDHLDNGYRVDLCRWDWRTPDSIDPGGEAKCRVDAARGYQATRVRILPNVVYEYSATGSWATSPDGPLTDAGGEAEGRGRLLGVVGRDYRLFEPFELGKTGRFVSPVSGHLYVRCSDDWTSLDDNRGHIRLAIHRP